MDQSSAPINPAARPARTISHADAFPDTPARTLPAYYIPGAYVSGRTGAVTFGHQNERAVHGGVLFRGEDNGRRAARRRIERQARRERRRAVRR